MKNDFSALALSTAVASAALLLLTAGGAWAGSAGGHGPYGKHMSAGHDARGCMHRTHPHHRHGPSDFYGAPRGNMFPGGPRDGHARAMHHPRTMHYPMYGRPMYGSSPGGMRGPEYMTRPSEKRTPGKEVASTQTEMTVDRADGASAESADVEISGMRFAPAEIRVKAGDKVTWRHRDRAPHTVTGRDASLASQTLQPGASFTHRFDEAGTYEYYCSLHPSMSGTVIVE
jgi:plastocyanin